jgi:hypothetical protein
MMFYVRDEGIQYTARIPVPGIGDFILKCTYQALHRQLRMNQQPKNNLKI